MSSFYNRRDEGDTIVFAVTPAPYPGSLQANMALIGGAILILISLPMMAILIGFLFLPIGLLVVFQGIRLMSKRSAENANRVPSEIRVGPTSIAAKGRDYKADDVVEFTVTHQAAGPAKVRYESVTTSSQAIGATIRDNTANAQSHVGYEASVRLRSDSRPIILAGGLTEQTASTLTRDLAEALVRARQAA